MPSYGQMGRENFVSLIVTFRMHLPLRDYIRDHISFSSVTNLQIGQEWTSGIYRAIPSVRSQSVCFLVT